MRTDWISGFARFRLRGFHFMESDGTDTFGMTEQAPLTTNANVGRRAVAAAAHIPHTMEGLLA